MHIPYVAVVGEFNMSFLYKRSIWLLILLFAYNSFSLAKDSEINVSIAISKNILSTFKSWTTDKNCWEVTDYEAKHSNRGAAEIVLICKAFHLGGLNAKLDFYVTPNYTRSLLLAQQKKVHMTGESIWKDQADSSRFYVSPPVLRINEMEKGIYTTKDHPMMKYVQSFEDIRHYRGVTLPNWHHDWGLLRSLTKKVMSAPSSISVHKMIEKNRADFTLAEFSSSMTFELGKVILYPVPNVKVTIKQSRHFIVRKDMENSLKIITALNKGVVKMRSLGKIREIYTKTGFITPKTSDWKELKLTAQP